MPGIAEEKASKHTTALSKYNRIRGHSIGLCDPLEIEDFVAQPSTDVSPPKWHLAHTTWFFENFLLVPFLENYKVFHKEYSFLFNSYYVSVGARWMRAERGYLTRPTVSDIYKYREYVDEQMRVLLNQNLSAEVLGILELGFQHEQQHQELLLYDIKYILGQNPLFPVYKPLPAKPKKSPAPMSWLAVAGGNYEIGYEGNDFHFDNELGRHTVFIHRCEVASRLVNVGEYLEFMNEGGYDNTEYWLAEGWDWVQKEKVRAPLYWIQEDGGWSYYTLQGLQPLNLSEPVAHVSFYEADAFARWKGVRLPTEYEWEVASLKYEKEIPNTANFVESGAYSPINDDGHGFFGNLWEWTSSAYRPYPFYKAPPGAIGEYNGKFMINQMVLRGGSYATARDHIRPTYRNFFHPHLQWHFNGIRLARHT